MKHDSNDEHNGNDGCKWEEGVFPVMRKCMCQALIQFK